MSTYKRRKIFVLCPCRKCDKKKLQSKRVAGDHVEIQKVRDLIAEQQKIIDSKPSTVASIEDTASQEASLENSSQPRLDKDLVPRSISSDAMIQSDGIGASLLRQNKESSEEDDFQYTHKPTRENLEEAEEKCDLIDPGRRDMQKKSESKKDE